MLDVDVFDTPVVIGYPPGSGGNRLRRMLVGVPWAIEPGQELHRINEVRKYTQDHDYPKFPTPHTEEVELPELKKFPVLITHGMHSVHLRRIFPGRKIVKIYCDLHDSIRRHWVVFSRGKMLEKIIQYNLQPIDGDDIQEFIRWSLDYYRNNINFEHDHAVLIRPGEGEFEDFMLQEFAETQDAEFDLAWQQILENPNYGWLANLPMIQHAAAKKP